MPAETTLNGDTKIILHRLDELSATVQEIKEQLKATQAIGDERIRTLEIRQAVLIKSQENCANQVCSQVEKLETKINRNDVLGSVLGAVGAWIAAVLTYLGLSSAGH